MQIKIDNISLSYVDKKGSVPVLKDYSLNVPSGKITAILGDSGSGKTTLLNTIAGIIKPDSGHIYFDNNDVTLLVPHKRNIGYVFQHSALYPYLNIRNNILFPLSHSKLSKKEKFEKVNALAESLNILDLLDRKPGELSGGEARRVALARALIKSPQLLLLDEPFSALDEHNKKDAMKLLKKTQKSLKITVIFVTHDHLEASFLADNLVKLK